jgi:L-threonine kinase
MAPGTCGELAQGMLDGILCMVTCPIDMYSTATVELSPGGSGISAPADSPKARRAVSATLDYLGAAGMEASLSLDSRLPRGKGMASSTADVAAAIAATGAALDRELSPAQVAEIALGVEPSDGVMFPNVSIFDHRKGRIAVTLGTPPPMRVVVLDFGGSVDTLEFNRTDRDGDLKRLGPRMAEAVSLIKDGIVRGDPLRIGHGATVSAVANQEVLFNPHLEPVLELSRRVGARILFVIPAEAGIHGRVARNAIALPTSRRCSIPTWSLPWSCRRS